MQFAVDEERGVVLVDGVHSYNVADNNMEFVHDNVTYVLYKNTLSARKHKNTQVFDLYANAWSVIPKHVGDDLVQCFANIVPVVDVGVSPNKKCIDAISDLIKNLHQMLNTSVNFNNKEERDNYEQLKTMIDLVVKVLASIDESQLCKYLTYSNMEVLKLAGANSSERYESIRQYIVMVITFKEDILNYRSLSIMYDVFMVVIGSLLLLHSTTLAAFTSTQDLIVHEICILFESLIYDRCSKILFIDGRNSIAKGIYSDMKLKYPELKAITRDSDIAKIYRYTNNFTQENERYQMTLFPYMIFYSMPDQLRIKNNIKQFHQMSLDLKKRRADNGEFDSFEKMYESVNEFYTKLVQPLNNSSYILYSAQSLQDG